MEDTAFQRGSPGQRCDADLATPGGRALLDCSTTVVVVRSMVSDVLHALLQQAFKMLWISVLSGQGRVSDSDAMPGCYLNILTNTTDWAVSGGELLV